MNFTIGEPIVCVSNNIPYQYKKDSSPFENDNNELVSLENNNYSATNFNLLSSNSLIPNSKKLLLNMGNNDKKRWLMKKYGFKNLREISNKHTHLIYSILNDISVKFIHVSK